MKKQNIIIGIITFTILSVLAVVGFNIHEKRVKEFEAKMYSNLVGCHMSNIDLIIENIELETKHAEEIYDKHFNVLLEKGKNYEYATTLLYIDNNNKNKKAWSDALNTYVSEQRKEISAMTTEIGNLLNPLANSLIDEINTADEDLNTYISNYIKEDDYEMNNALEKYRLSLSVARDIAEKTKNLPSAYLNNLFNKTNPEQFHDKGKRKALLYW